MYIKGTRKTASWAITTAMTAHLEWLASQDAICVNFDVNPGGPASWESGMAITKDGDLYIMRDETFSFASGWSGISFTWGQFSPYNPISEIVVFFPHLVDAYPSGQVDHSNLTFIVYGDLGTCKIGTYGITESATNEQLHRANLFNEGLIYKTLVINDRTIGTVWDVFNEDTLFLMTDYEGEEDLTQPQSNWKFLGLAEAGAYLNHFEDEGIGAFLHQEFEPGSGLTAVGLAESPFGVEVLFKEKSFIVSWQGTDDLPDEVSVHKQRLRDATIAPKSIVLDRHQNRLSLTTRPRGIARIAGGQSEIITDASGNRMALGDDVEASTLDDAVGAFYSDNRGDYYLISNIDRVGATTGQHSLRVNVRTGEYHLTRLDSMEISALAVIQDDNGDDVVVYGDQSGNIGYLFLDTEDLSSAMSWEYRIAFIPADLQPVTITGLRLFAQSPMNAAGTAALPFAIECTIYDVGSQWDRSDLRGDLSAFTSSGPIVFTESSQNLDQFIAPTDTLTSTGFVFKLTGSSKYEIQVKGLEIEFTQSGEVEVTR
jgi:hypothetical protein